MGHIKLTRHRSTTPGGGSSASTGRAGARSQKAGYVAGAFCLAVITTLGTATSASAGTSSPRTFPASDVTFTGHGNGPGYGMGQWGAFGYAALLHWTYQRILAQVYSDPAAPVTLQTLSSTVDDTHLLKVVIEENDNDAMTVTSGSAFTFVKSSGGTIASIPAGQAARAVETGAPGALTGKWNLETATSCTSSSWKVIATGLTDPVAVPASQSATAPKSQLLTLCRGDGLDVTYRGELEAFDYFGSNTGGEHLERTLDIVYLEQYVADVVPGESPSGWGTYGGTSGAPQSEPWGFQELEAQAVAVRTYVLYVAGHGGWYGYASICDDICQYYARGIQYESTLTNLATSDTKGEYLEQSGRGAPTEYASSDGGYTETLSYPGGPVIFDAVPDAGDQVCIGGSGLGCNPWHTWSASIPVTTIERLFPSVGTLESVKVTSTDVSKRVVEIEVVGNKATTSVSGGTFASDFAFTSTLFTVTDGPGATERAGSAGPGLMNAARSASGPGFQLPVGAPRSSLLTSRSG
jgi:SpoIID/LytB domain protein